MDLSTTVILNRKILTLIESKYTEPSSLWPKTPESRYYAKLLDDTRKAELALEHGGLVPIDDTTP